MRDTFEAVCRCLRIAGSCFIENDLRNVKVEVIASRAPPLLCDLLSGSLDEIRARPGSQVARYSPMYIFGFMPDASHGGRHVQDTSIGDMEHYMLVNVHSQTGSGLGLVIVHAYGGSVAAASEGPNRGSRFVVRFSRYSSKCPERGAECRAGTGTRCYI